MNIDHALQKLRKLLPYQGSIDVFIHRNFLRSFENMHFHDAVCSAGEKKSAEPYMMQDFYINEFNRGRFTKKNIIEKCPEDIAEHAKILGFLLKIDSVEFIQKAITSPDSEENIQTIKWRFSHDYKQYSDLWQQILAHFSAHDVKKKFKETTEYVAKNFEQANKITIDFLSLYFDQGVSYWPIERDAGLLKTFFTKIVHFEKYVPSFLRQLDVNWMQSLSGSAEEIIQNVLIKFSIKEEEILDFFYWALRDIVGWSGLICFYEDNKKFDVSLKSFLALRLLIIAGVAGESGFEKRSRSLKKSFWTPCFRIFELLLRINYPKENFKKISHQSFISLLQFVEKLDSLTKRRILHEAYEQSFYEKTLTNLVHHKKTINHVAVKSFSAVFCVDDREESFRRYLEALDPSCDTYSYAGFFNIDMLYKKAGGKKAQALCPAVITPQKVIEEVSAQRKTFMDSFFSSFKLWQKSIHIRSKSLIAGSFLHLSFMLFSIFADFFKMISPSLYTRIFLFNKKMFRSMVKTKIDIDMHVGSKDSFSYDEMADKVCSMLVSIGLHNPQTKFIFIVGHGSSNLNNAHLSAYNCMACGGQEGAPNARAFAAMANNPKVRQGFLSRGVVISEDTWFVGTYHDTCSDEIIFYETEGIPLSQKAVFEKCKKTFLEACEFNAEERLQRFVNVPALPRKKALQHMQTRSFRYAEARAEYGHATNAVAFVGRRDLTRGLSFNRRCFLISYEPHNDFEGDILAGLLSAAVPVCLGINLDYYFSTVDNNVYGSGSKLSHNITGLVGVMHGAASDFLTGMPEQAVEIHEPMRLLLIIEASMEKLLKVKEKYPYAFLLAENGWIHLVSYNPETESVQFFPQRRPDGAPI